MPEETNMTSEAMDSPIQEISIDLLNNKLYEYIYAKQYDAGRLIKIWITADNEDFDLVNCFITFLLKKPDGTFIMERLDKTLEDGKYYVTLNITNQMTIYPGKIPFQIVVSETDFTLDPEDNYRIHFDESKSLSTVTGYILVEESVVKDDDVESEIEIQVIQQLFDAISDVGSTIQACDDAADIAREKAADAEQSVVDCLLNVEESKDWANNSEYNAKVSKSYAVGGTNIPHEGHSDAEDNAKYYCEQAADSLSKITLYKIVTLYANQWDSNNQQIVEVIGVQEDESTELIEVIPTNADIEDYVEYGVLCINQGDDTLKFSCKTTPARDLQAYVLVRRIFEGEDGVHAIVIDDELSTTSTNAVQNKVVTNALNGKMDNTYQYKVILDQNSSQEDIAKYLKVRNLTGDRINRVSLIKNLNVLYMTIIVEICNNVGQNEEGVFFAFNPDIFEGTEEFGKIVPEYDFDAMGTFGGTRDPVARTVTFKVEAGTQAHNCFVNTYAPMTVTSMQYLRFTAQWVVND